MGLSPFFFVFLSNGFTLPNQHALRTIALNKTRPFSPIKVLTLSTVTSVEPSQNIIYEATVL